MVFSIVLLSFDGVSAIRWLGLELIFVKENSVELFLG